MNGALRSRYNLAGDGPLADLARRDPAPEGVEVSGFFDIPLSLDLMPDGFWTATHKEQTTHEDFPSPHEALETTDLVIA